MIRSYSDHAANERTLLAWVRTGTAVIAFGFVSEMLDSFVVTIASANSLDVGRRLLIAGIAVMIAVSAMASQYALLRVAVPGAISTAVMTGNLTNAVLSLMDGLSPSHPLMTVDSERLKRSLRLLISFSWAALWPPPLSPCWETGPGHCRPRLPRWRSRCARRVFDILSQAKIISPDTVLDASSLAAVKMPNRDGFIPDPRPDKFPPVADTPHQILAMPPSAK